jgi:glutathione S-transferase
MRATLYGLLPSHPTHTARLMLERKGIDHKVRNLPPGSHAVALRLLGFRGGTVPALKLGRQRVQGSLAISRALDQAQPEPLLFPTDSELRTRVEDAERWGDEILQPVPRWLTRWITVNRPEFRAHMARESGIPVAGVAGRLNGPVAWYFARKVRATDDRVRDALATLPALIEQVEGLLDEGTIGAEEPNAADFQIAPSIRSLATFGDLAPALEGREATRYARSILPEYPTTVPAGYLPAEWLEPLAARD